MTRRGFTLVETLVGIALLGLSAVALSTIGANSYQSYRTLKAELELETMKVGIRNRFDCARTVSPLMSLGWQHYNDGLTAYPEFPTQGCSILDGNGKAVVTAVGTTMGSFKVRTTCNAYNAYFQFNVEATLDNPKDDLGGLLGKMSGNQWVPLYEGLPLTCESQWLNWPWAANFELVVWAFTGRKYLTHPYVIGNWHNGIDLGIYADNTTYAKICEIMGFPVVGHDKGRPKTSNWSSPGDNAAIRWVPSQNTFTAVPGATAHHAYDLLCKRY